MGSRIEGVPYYLPVEDCHQSPSTCRFIAETPVGSEEEPPLNAAPPKLEVSNDDCWTLFVDGAFGEEDGGVDLILMSPEGEKITYALRFDFKTSNNEAEYEAMITGLKIAAKMGIKKIRAYSDTQLVINQITGAYEARDDVMKQYLGEVSKLVNHFKSFRVDRVT